jgi:hypothetical protein
MRTIDDKVAEQQNEIYQRLISILSIDDFSMGGGKDSNVVYLKIKTTKKQEKEIEKVLKGTTAIVLGLNWNKKNVIEGWRIGN